MTAKLLLLANSSLSRLADEDFECPHCGRHQVTGSVYANMSACHIQVRQCLSCRELQVEYAEYHRPPGQIETESRAPPRVLHPALRLRPALPFVYVPIEILQAYQEACDLVSVHIGASGAYARRALELLLDGLGYAKPSLAESIKAAKGESALERRLPPRLLARLDYVKEIGNFALHIRRDQELAIIEIDPTEVEACLETIEELLAFVFEEPGRDYERAVELNKRLLEAQKKPIALPDGPGALWTAPQPPAGEAE